jgi:hypothetical protein
MLGNFILVSQLPVAKSPKLACHAKNCNLADLAALCVLTFVNFEAKLLHFLEHVTLLRFHHQTRPIVDLSGVIEKCFFHSNVQAPPKSIQEDQNLGLW